VTERLTFATIAPGSYFAVRGRQFYTIRAVPHPQRSYWQVFHAEPDDELFYEEVGRAPTLDEAKQLATTHYHVHYLERTTRADDVTDVASYVGAILLAFVFAFVGILAVFLGVARIVGR